MARAPGGRLRTGVEAASRVAPRVTAPSFYLHRALGARRRVKGGGPGRAGRARVKAASASRRFWAGHFGARGAFTSTPPRLRPSPTPAVVARRRRRVGRGLDGPRRPARRGESEPEADPGRAGAPTGTPRPPARPLRPAGTCGDSSATAATRCGTSCSGSSGHSRASAPPAPPATRPGPGPQYVGRGGLEVGGRARPDPAKDLHTGPDADSAPGD